MTKEVVEKKLEELARVHEANTKRGVEMEKDIQKLVDKGLIFILHRGAPWPALLHEVVDAVCKKVALMLNHPVPQTAKAELHLFKNIQFGSNGHPGLIGVSVTVEAEGGRAIRMQGLIKVEEKKLSLDRVICIGFYDGDDLLLEVASGRIGPHTSVEDVENLINKDAPDVRPYVGEFLTKYAHSMYNSRGALSDDLEKLLWAGLAEAYANNNVRWSQ